MREIETGGGRGYTPPRKPRRTATALDVLPSKRGAPARGYRPPVARQVVRKAEQIRRTRQAQVKDTKGNADRLPEAQRLAVVDKANRAMAEHVIAHPKNYRNSELAKNLARTGYVKLLDGWPGEGDLLHAGTGPISGPILKVLDQTTRPVHAIAAGADAAIKGENVGRAAKRGLQNKDKTTFSRVLKDAGAPKAVQGVGGFALDVGLDPTTYLSGGTAAIAKKSAAESAERAALRAGLSADQAARFGQMAQRQAAKTVTREPLRGVTVKVAGHEVPGVRQATGQTVGRVARRTAQTRPGQTVRAVVGDVNPGLAPRGATRAESDAATSAARTTRARTGRSVVESQNRAIALRKALGQDDMQVVHAVETGTIGRLPEHLRAPARELESTYKHIRRVEKRAGIRGGTIGAQARRVQPRSPKLPSREEFIANRPKASVLDDPPSIENLRRNLPDVGPPGVHVETPQMEDYNPRDRNDIQLGDEIDGLKAVVARDEHGRIVGALRMTLDERGHADILQVAVDPAHRGRGLASELYRAGERAGLKVEDASGRGGLTEAGAALKHKRLTAAARDRVAAPSTKGVRQYVPHYTNEQLGTTGKSARGGSTGRRRVVMAESRARREGTLAEKAAANPGVYNEDAALAFGHRLISSAKAVGQANLNRRIADELGTPVRRGAAYDPETHGIFLLKGSDLKEIRDPAEIARIESGYRAQGGRYVILNRELLAKAHQIAAPTADRGAIGAGFDRVTGGFKTIATVPNPGFHLRNLVGGAQNAYLGVPGQKLPKLLASSARDLRRLGKQEEAQRTLGKRIPDAGSAAEAAQVGGIRSGVLGAELHDLLRKDGMEMTGGRISRAKRAVSRTPAGRAGRAVKRTLQNIEDLPRLAVYKHGRDIGMSPEEASRLANKYLFDYSVVTPFERGARRVAPFYTFSARNIPLQASHLVSHPGKFANFQKAREEVQQATGTDPGYEGNLPEYEQRQAPFGVRIRGAPFTASVGLPLTDLNEVPTSLNPAKAADEWLNRGISMVNPVLKDPVEIWANYSSFFRGPIRTRDTPQVAAPDFVGSFPPWAKKAFHIKKMLDRRSGRMVWKWDAKVNYIAHAVPGPVQSALNLSSSGVDRQGRGGPEKAAAYLGLKLTPTDAATNTINQLYDQLDRLTTERGRLNKAGVSRADDLKRLALNLEARKVEQQIWQLSLKRGDRVLPAQGRPTSGRGPSPSAGFGGGGLGGGLGGGGLGGGIG